MDLKDINLGFLVKNRVADYGIGMSRICNFFNLSEKEIIEMYGKKSLDTKTLLKWSKLLEYDFFRVYSQHLLLCPQSGRYKDIPSSLPKFRKNTYTKEVIENILHSFKNGEKTKQQIIDEYRIPKTTLYKWIKTYSKESSDDVPLK